MSNMPHPSLLLPWHRDIVALIEQGYTLDQARHALRAGVSEDSIAAARVAHPAFDRAIEVALEVALETSSADTTRRRARTHARTIVEHFAAEAVNPRQPLSHRVPAGRTVIEVAGLLHQPPADAPGLRAVMELARAVAQAPGGAVTVTQATQVTVTQGTVSPATDTAPSP